MQDALGDRMKGYEDVYRFSLPRRSYTLIRVDGKAFHTYTKGLDKPFDIGLIEDMNATAAFLCKNIMGAKFAYVQSDEISILLTDFEEIDTQAWFANNLQKMASVAASMATARFNQLRLGREAANCGDLVSSQITSETMAMFDARVWQIPQRVEVENYFIWRQQDATRNSISSVAQSLYSHKQLNGKSSNEKQEMIFQKGINWNDYSFREKRGGIISRVSKKKILCSLDDTNMINNVKKSNNQWYADRVNDEFGVFHKEWDVIETPVFTQDREFLNKLIPVNQ